MTIDPHDDVLARIVQASAQLMGRDAPDPDDPRTAFVRRFYAPVDPDDLAGHSDRDLAAAALAHFELARRRGPDEALVSVVNPSLDEHGWRSPHTVIDVVTDDRPFLVDSVSMVLARHGIGTHLMVHPIEEVDRANDGTVVAFGEGGPAEAWIHVEVERQADPQRRAQLHDELHAAIGRTRAIDQDAHAMRERALAVAGDAPGSETAVLLGWLAAGHFLFTAYREYRVDAADGAGNGERVLRAVPGTGLGTLRDDLLAPETIPFSAMRRDQRLRFEEPEPYVFTKDPERSTVVRADYLEYVGVKVFAPDGTVVGERRFLGLFDASVSRQSIFDIPILTAKANAVIAASGLSLASHSGRELIDTLEVFPRDELFQVSVEELTRIAIGITRLQERKQVRLFARRDRFGRFVSCLVYVPRDRFSTTVADRIVEILRSSYGGTSTEHDNRVTERILARVHVLVHLADDAPDDVDDDAVEERLAAITRWWVDDLRDELVTTHGEDHGLAVLGETGEAFPAAYREAYAPEVAVADLERIATLTPASPLTTALTHPLGAQSAEWRLKLYALGEPLPLSAILPLLENLGMRVIDERPFHLRMHGGVWLHDLGLQVAPGGSLDDEAVRAELQRTFLALWRGEIENDGFNTLVARAGLRSRDIVVLRAYARYLRQIGLPFTPSYVEATLSKHATITADLVRLFAAKFDPDRQDVQAGDPAGDVIAARITTALDAVTSLDEDRILRAVLGVVRASVRTNAYRAASAPDVPCSPALSIKLDPAAIPDLPLPRPLHEIWVYSPRVEGVHLRGGAIARGGLRWSDRREDFRTEVLGLMKAQMVKNAVIVPVGAKGGFYPKQLPADAAGRRVEAVGCYEDYVAALLDVTDNLVDGKPVPPAGVVRHDGDDPYLVVAADKGTATFSDLANSVAARYGFWLGDAFASGGSAGYDHKEMGITARGAWESVRRHFRVLGTDADTAPLTVVGIGDMSGDVFGNGMLLSTSMRLLAAFDHRHVFLDPNPEPTRSHAERQRLFELPGSSWDDYDRSLISTGGGVFPRAAKSIPVTAEVAAVLGIEESALTPADLIRAILRAPVDLLWNGGIGTYVKASTEIDADAGDRSNDAVRINGNELRCRVVAEGGNLGFTQRGRVEAALNGVFINTDAIDNSAGVDCSDHEVNIKIALDAVVRAGDLTTKQRNEVLASMTDEVGELVLNDNRAQTRALAIARSQAFTMADVHGRQIRSLELAGLIDRQLEFLPDEKTLAERHTAGTGLTTPEFAVLLAYTKDTTTAAVLTTTLPDDPYVASELVTYFPTAMRDRFADAIAAHPLRREIVATCLVNDMVNHAGLSFEHRMNEETSATAPDTARAHVVARDVFDLRSQWHEIDGLGEDVDPGQQIALFLELRRLVERGTRWLLRHRRSPIDLAGTVAAFRPGVVTLAASFPELLTGHFAASVRSVAERYAVNGVPEVLARRASGWPFLHTTLDIVELATQAAVGPEQAARTYWSVFERLDLTWLWEQIGQLPRSDRWRNQARAALRDDLLAELRSLTRDALGAPDGIDGWAASNEVALQRATSLFAEIRTQGVYDLATLTVALRQVRNLTVSST